MRGALGNAVVWAAAWGIGATLWGLGEVILGPASSIAFWRVAGPAVYGFVCGLTFSAVLASARGRVGLMDLKGPRLAAWGFAAGLAPIATLLGLIGLGVATGRLSPVSIPAEFYLDVLTFFGLPGIVTALGTVKLAQGAVLSPSGEAAALSESAEPRQVD